MEREKVIIADSEIARQREIMGRVKDFVLARKDKPMAMVDTYGCQQNEADSERIRGMLREMGYTMTQDEKQADVVVINSCAVREHAEDRVLGNIGALSHTKKANPNQKICLCGCMAAEKRVLDKVKSSYPYVDLVFPPDALWRFPELLETSLLSAKRQFIPQDTNGTIAEGIPNQRDGKTKAWVSIMYGCNNFCSYCIVPYVRGRERSRDPEVILNEVRELAAQGYKDITLLGQNVNSYGKDLPERLDFSDLLRRINDVPGDFVIRCMTSHPKDASEKLFRTMAQCEKVAPQLHLPFQAGNDRVLKKMNRGYDRAKYLALTEIAREYMPDIVLTSDVIVGFPGETDEEFEDTLTLVEQVRFDALFTFIYSPRSGTPAAEMPDPYTREQKQVRFDKLIDLQNSISREKHKSYVGRTLRVLVDGAGTGKHDLAARTRGGRLVHLDGDSSLIGKFIDVRITDSSTWALVGEPV